MSAAAKDLQHVSRREFLHYVWGSSIALLLAQGTGIAFWFALPRLRQYMTWFEVQDLPARNQEPFRKHVSPVRFFVTHTDEGIAFLDDRCTHSGCYMPWTDQSKIFACPCHGSQFALGGDYVAGPAPRAMDRYAFEIQSADGHVLARASDGEAVPLPEGAATVWVNTAFLLKGKSHI